MGFGVQGLSRFLFRVYLEGQGDLVCSIIKTMTMAIMWYKGY